MTEYTPGPWRAGFDNDPIQIGSADRFVSMTLPCESSGATGEDEANARLIAEAPALFELAEAFVSYLQDDSKSPRRRDACLREALEIISQIQEERKP